MVFLATAFSANAQTAGISSSASSANWTLGGSAGLGGSFGSKGSTSVYVQPRVGYKIIPQLELGVAGSFTWTNSNYYSSTTVGVGPFISFYPIESIYLGALFQEYFFNQKLKPGNTKYTGEEAALYLGGGYVQRIGNNASMQIGGMYNVLYDKNKSVFSSGFVPSIGVVFGI